MSQSLQMLSLDSLRESDLNPRRHFAEASLAELAENIRQVGVLTPLLVRPSENPDGMRYEIAGGHRRYRAAERAGLEEVPCIVRELSDDEFLEILTLDNLHREDVHPLDEAAGYKALLSHGHDIDTLAAKVGKSVSYIYQRLKLLDLVDDAQRAFLDNEITAGHAILLARLAPSDQPQFLEDCLDDWTVAELRRSIEGQLYMSLDRAPFPIDDASLPGGSCVECPKRTGHNMQLFPDITVADTCTDKACHAGKVAAWLDAIYKKKKCTLRVSAAYTAPKGFPKFWTPAGKNNCDDTEIALVVDSGWHANKDWKAGAVTKVCTNAKCATHNGEGVAQAAASRAHRSERSAEREAEEAAKVQAFNELVAAIRSREDVPDEAWRAIGDEIFRFYDTRGALLTALNLPADASGEAVFEHLQARTGIDLARDVLVILASKILFGYGNPEENEQAFIDAYVAAGEVVDD